MASMHIQNYNETENDLLLSQDNNLEFFPAQRSVVHVSFNTHYFLCSYH